MFAWSDLVPIIVLTIAGIIVKLLGSTTEVLLLLVLIGIALQIVLVVYRIAHFISVFEDTHVPTLEEVYAKLKRFG